MTPTQREAVRLGKQAEIVLDNEAFKQAFVDMEQYLLDKLRQTDPWETDKRDARVKQIFAIEQIQKYLNDYMGKGALPKIRDTTELTLALDALGGLKIELEGMVRDAEYTAKKATDEDT